MARHAAGLPRAGEFRDQRPEGREILDRAGNRRAGDSPERGVRVYIDEG